MALSAMLAHKHVHTLSCSARVDGVAREGFGSKISNKKEGAGERDLFFGKKKTLYMQRSASAPCERERIAQSPGEEEGGGRNPLPPPRRVRGRECS
jgi:hypothetical protein